MNIKQLVLTSVLAITTVVASYTILQHYQKSHQSHEQRARQVFQDIDEQISKLHNQNATTQIDDQDVVIQGCYGLGWMCGTEQDCCGGYTCKNYVCSCASPGGPSCSCSSQSDCVGGSCCVDGLCQDTDCCGNLDAPCTGQSGNTHGSCCTEYICGQCYVPNNGSNDIQAAPDGQAGLCQSNSSYTLLPCGSGGLGVACVFTAECQSQYVCQNGFCSCAQDEPQGIGCPCTSNTECAQGNCYLGLCQAPESNCLQCYNPGQCASGNCVDTDGDSYCYIEGCKYGMETCNSCFEGSNCAPCNDNSNCESGNCVNGLCYIMDCMYGATACGSCNSGDLGDTCNSDSNCQSQYQCLNGFCSCGTPAGYNCPCSSNGTCVSGLICADTNLCADCYADGGPCNNDSQCCNNTCIAGLCSYAPANGGECAENGQCSSGNCDNLNASETGVCADCLDVDVQCWNGGQCCSGVCSPEGYCFCAANSDGLLPNNCPCTTANECQSNNCVAGYCSGCYGVAELCAGDNQCCSNNCIEEMCSCAPSNGCVCNSNGQCDTGNCYAGLCENCESLGMLCDSDAQCCPGLVCSIEEGQASNTCNCSTSEPAANGCKCSTQSECASGFCQDGLCSATESIGMHCDTPNECSSHQCIDNACSCAPNQGCVCNSNSQCGSGNCYAGLCESCASTAMTCSDPGQCCSGICTMPDGISGQCGCSAPPNAESSCSCVSNGDCASGNCVAGLCQNCFAAGLACSQNYECCNSDCSDFICGGIDEWVNWIIQAVSMIVITILVAFSGGALAGLYTVFFAEDAALEAVTIGVEEIAEETAIESIELGTIDTIADLPADLTDEEVLAALGFEETAFDTTIQAANNVITAMTSYVAAAVAYVNSYLVMLPALDFGIEEAVYKMGDSLFSKYSGEISDEELAVQLAKQTATTTEDGSSTITTMTGEDGVSATKTVTENANGTDTIDVSVTDDGDTKTYSDATAQEEKQAFENSSEYQQFTADQSLWNDEYKPEWQEEYKPTVDQTLNTDAQTIKGQAQANKAADEASKSATTTNGTTTTTIDLQQGGSISKSVGTDSKSLEFTSQEGQTADISATKDSTGTQINAESINNDTLTIDDSTTGKSFSAENSTSGQTVSGSSTVEANGTDEKTLTITENGVTKTVSNAQVLADKTALTDAQEEYEAFMAQTKTIKTVDGGTITSSTTLNDGSKTITRTFKNSTGDTTKVETITKGQDGSITKTSSSTVKVKDGTETIDTTETNGVKTTTKTYKDKDGKTSRTETITETKNANGTITKTEETTDAFGFSKSTSRTFDQEDNEITRTHTDSTGTKTVTTTTKNADGGITTVKTTTTPEGTTRVETINVDKDGVESGTVTTTLKNGQTITYDSKAAIKTEAQADKTTVQTDRAEPKTEKLPNGKTVTTSESEVNGVKTSTKIYKNNGGQTIRTETTTENADGSVTKTASSTVPAKDGTLTINTTETGGIKTTEKTYNLSDGSSVTKDTTVDKTGKEISTSTTRTGANGSVEKTVTDADGTKTVTHTATTKDGKTITLDSTTTKTVVNDDGSTTVTTSKTIHNGDEFTTTVTTNGQGQVVSRSTTTSKQLLDGSVQKNVIDEGGDFTQSYTVTNKDGDSKTLDLGVDPSETIENDKIDIKKSSQYQTVQTKIKDSSAYQKLEPSNMFRKWFNTWTSPDPLDGQFDPIFGLNDDWTQEELEKAFGDDPEYEQLQDDKAQEESKIKDSSQYQAVQTKIEDSSAYQTAKADQVKFQDSAQYEDEAARLFKMHKTPPKTKSRNWAEKIEKRDLAKSSDVTDADLKTIKSDQVQIDQEYKNLEKEALYNGDTYEATLLKIRKNNEKMRSAQLRDELDRKAGSGSMNNDALKAYFAEMDADTTLTKTGDEVSIAGSKGNSVSVSANSSGATKTVDIDGKSATKEDQVSSSGTDTTVTGSNGNSATVDRTADEVNISVTKDGATETKYFESQRPVLRKSKDILFPERNDRWVQKMRDERDELDRKAGSGSMNNDALKAYFAEMDKESGLNLSGKLDGWLNTAKADTTLTKTGDEVSIAGSKGNSVSVSANSSGATKTVDIDGKSATKEDQVSSSGTDTTVTGVDSNTVSVDRTTSGATISVTKDGTTASASDQLDALQQSIGLIQYQLDDFEVEEFSDIDAMMKENDQLISSLSENSLDLGVDPSETIENDKIDIKKSSQYQTVQTKIKDSSAYQKLEPSNMFRKWFNTWTSPDPLDGQFDPIFGLNDDWTQEELEKAFGDDPEYEQLQDDKAQEESKIEDSSAYQTAKVDQVKLQDSAQYQAVQTKKTSWADSFKELWQQSPLHSKATTVESDLTMSSSSVDGITDKTVTNTATDNSVSVSADSGEVTKTADIDGKSATKNITKNSDGTVTTSVTLKDGTVVTKNWTDDGFVIEHRINKDSSQLITKTRKGDTKPSETKLIDKNGKETVFKYGSDKITTTFIKTGDGIAKQTTDVADSQISKETQLSVSGKDTTLTGSNGNSATVDRTADEVNISVTKDGATESKYFESQRPVLRKSKDILFPERNDRWIQKMRDERDELDRKAGSGSMNNDALKAYFAEMDKESGLNLSGTLDGWLNTAKADTTLTKTGDEVSVVGEKGNSASVSVDSTGINKEIVTSSGNSVSVNESIVDGTENKSLSVTKDGTTETKSNEAIKNQETAKKSEIQQQLADNSQVQAKKQTWQELHPQLAEFHKNVGSTLNKFAIKSKEAVKKSDIASKAKKIIYGNDSNALANLQNAFDSGQFQF